MLQTIKNKLYFREKTSKIEVESIKRTHETHKNRFTMTRRESSHDHNVKRKHFDFNIGHQGPIATNYAYVLYLSFTTYFPIIYFQE